ncbi:MAG: AraC family transcriptional regulator [Kofleriaceae bacterium]
MQAAVGFEQSTVEHFTVSRAPVLAICGDVRRRHFPLRVTDSLAVIVNTGGEQTIIADGKRVTIPPGAAIFRPPNAVWTIPESQFGYACINLDHQLLPRGTRYEAFTWRPSHVMPAVPALIAALRRPASTLAREQAIVTAVEQLFAAGLARSGERFAGEPNTARRARDYLETCFTDHPSLDDIAAAAGTDRFALVRLFRRAYGITPHAFAVRLQVRRAQRMLAARESLHYVASSVGFADLSHMTRHFRRVLGVTPGAYARSVQFRSTD